MATVIYRNCLKKFWKRMENVDVALTTGSTDTWTGNIQRFTPNSGSIPGIADYYFYDAGLSLVRVLAGLTYDEVYQIYSGLISEEIVTLTSGTGVITTTNIAHIYDRQLVYTDGNSTSYAMAQLLKSWEKEEIINNLNPRKTPSALQRYFDINGADVNVYPTTYNRIKIKFLRFCPLQVSGNSQDDYIPEILSDIWTDMACRLAGGDMKDSLEQIIFQQLQEKFSFLNKPKQASAFARENKI